MQSCNAGIHKKQLNLVEVLGVGYEMGERRFLISCIFVN